MSCFSAPHRGGHFASLLVYWGIVDSSVMCQFNLAPARILWAIVQKSDYLSRNIEQLELVTAQNHSTRRKEIVPFHLCTTKSTNTSSGVEETMLDHLL